jgi:glycerol-3-phosphate dehydrogenase
MRTRASLAKLANAPLDLLIIGGGIVGSGIARDAAMRGLKTALVEQHDFAFGTSSRSTRLLHGGIRYLASGRIGLVREASVEKRILHHIAPHLAEPLAFIFPTYPGTDWPLWQMRLGVKFYDLLCGGKNLGKSSALSKAATLQAVPHLQPARLTGAVRYFDGFTNDARLVLDTLRSAAAHGATLWNYCKFENALKDHNGWRCELKEQGASQSHIVLPKVVVNATGPWATDVAHSTIRLHLTKGIHLVVLRPRLPVSDAVVLTAGKRILFAIPWGERVILGTTDTDYTGSLDDVRAEPEDIAYVLQIVNEFFPTARISTSDIISTWAGLRPLIADAHASASDISRAHEIRNPERGWWDVAGGKLTTYRLIAEQAVDQIAAQEKWRLPRCSTAEEPLLKPEETAGVSGILPPPWSKSTVAHYCAHEWAAHLDDVMVRRASWHYYHLDASQKAAQVAEWMAEFLDWPTDQQARELSRYRSLFPPQSHSQPSMPRLTTRPGSLTF